MLANKSLNRPALHWIAGYIKYRLAHQILSKVGQAQINLKVFYYCPRSAKTNIFQLLPTKADS
jgi:hypothetical protein